MNEDGQGKLAEAMGLPWRPFLYTVDQVLGLFALPDDRKRTFFYYRGRTTFVKQRAHLEFINIALDNEKPEWRCDERELIRWMRFKGFRVSRATPRF